MAAGIVGPPHISFPIPCFLLLALLLMVPDLRLPFHNINSCLAVLGVLTLLSGLYPCFPALMPTSCSLVNEPQYLPDFILPMHHPTNGKKTETRLYISSGLLTLHQFTSVLANM